MYLLNLANLVALSHLTGVALSVALQRRLNDSLGLTPHMGWSSWVSLFGPIHWVPWS